MSISTWFQRSCQSRVLRDPAARAFILSAYATGESRGEGLFFEHLRELPLSERDRRLVDRHQADEIRHERLLNECLERMGVERQPLPEWLDYVEAVSAEARFPVHDPPRDARGVARGYLMLRAVERRQVERLTMLGDGIEPFDPHAAATVRRIAMDERGHIRVCEVIARALIGAEEAARVADEMEVIEARAFGRFGPRFQAHMLWARVREPSLVDRLFAAVLAARSWFGPLPVRMPAGERKVSTEVAPC